MDWHEPATAAGGGLLVAFAQWLLGRSDTAKARRDAEMKDVAQKVIAEQKIDIRLNTLEVVLPRVEAKIAETHDLVKSTNDTLNQLAYSGRLHIKD